MIKLFLKILLVFLFVTSTQLSFADTNVSGTISSDTIWNLADSPYIVTGNVTVNATKTLTIAAGVQVKFAGNYQLQINGKLNAQGTETQLISFSSNQAVPTVGYWNRIYFNSSDPTSVLSYCSIQYATTAIHVNSPNASISHCAVQNNHDGILIMHTANASVLNNNIANNTNYGIEIETIFGSVVPNPTINYNSIINNGVYGVFMWQNDINFDHRNSVINAQYNWWGTSDPLVIPNFIWDTFDSLYRPRVDFSNYLLTDPNNAILVTNNSVIPRFFNPVRNEEAVIAYTLSRDANITLRIKNSSNVVVRTLVNNQLRSLGGHTENWDGRDDQNQQLSQGQYYTYTIQAQTASGGLGEYNPSLDTSKPSISNVVYSPTQNFSPFRGDRLTVQYNLSAPALVWFGFDGVEYATQAPRDVSANVEHWNGRASSGQIYVSTQRPFYIQAHTQRLPDNVIGIVNKTSLDVTTLTSNPYLIRPLYHEATQITYGINEAATVTTSIVSPDGSQTLKVLEQDILRAPGSYVLSWDGKTATGRTASAADYRVRVRAVDSFGIATVRDGNIRVVY